MNNNRCWNKAKVNKSGVASTNLLIDIIKQILPNSLLLLLIPLI